MADQFPSVGHVPEGRALRRIDGIAHGDGFYALGVGREAPEALFAFGAGPRERVRYVERDIDEDLRLQLRDEPARDRLSVVIVTGPSGAGKSRTLSEALADVLPDASLVVPKDAANLVWLGQSGGPTGRSPRWVVWLDDLERFVRAGQEGAGLGNAERVSDVVAAPVDRRDRRRQGLGGLAGGHAALRSPS